MKGLKDQLREWKSNRIKQKEKEEKTKREI